MDGTQQATAQTEIHDPHILAQTRALLDACQSPREMQEAVLAAVARNAEWRGKRCLNLLAPKHQPAQRFERSSRLKWGHARLRVISARSIVGLPVPNISTKLRLSALNC